VRVRAAVDGRSMTISVSNSGTMRHQYDEGGYGLRNTMARLRLLYDHHASFSLGRQRRNGRDRDASTRTRP